MKILHAAAITPHGCGLYETARDLAAAERELGHDARLIDSTKPHNDRGVPTGNGYDFIKECDVIVSHSGPSKEMCKSGKPIVQIRHGRPRSTFLIESHGEGKIYSYLRNMRADKQHVAWVTMWPEHKPYWELVLGREVHVIPPPVDLKAFTPDGPKGYNWHGKGGAINVVVADMWRKDKDPFDVINGFAVFAKTHPGSKLHVFGNTSGMKAWPTLAACLTEHGWLGQTPGHVTGLANAYRAADMVITPHTCAVRTIREALACGCPVVCGSGIAGYLSFSALSDHPATFADAMHRCLNYDAQGGKDARAYAREYAEAAFDSKKSAQALIDVITGAINGKQ